MLCSIVPHSSSTTVISRCCGSLCRCHGSIGPQHQPVVRQHPERLAHRVAEQEAERQGEGRVSGVRQVHAPRHRTDGTLLVLDQLPLVIDVSVVVVVLVVVVMVGLLA